MTSVLKIKTERKPFSHRYYFLVSEVSNARVHSSQASASVGRSEGS